MGELIFPEGFLWGSATASYQIEGAVREGGRGESIWDRFSHTPGRTPGGETGDVACDHYHRYRDDVGLMKKLGLAAYRFSVSWPRILPEGRGEVNQEGMDFYRFLIDELLSNGIQPVVTLYHWDLPQRLQDRGGWLNRDTARCFGEYAALLFDTLHDRVNLWITVNEPWVAAFVGHEEGRHAPGLSDRTSALQVGHHLLLAHALAVRTYRERTNGHGRIGISLNLTPMHPSGELEEDQLAAIVADGNQNRWFLDPVLTGAYPKDMMELNSEVFDAPSVEEGDLEILGSNRPDFLGINYYTRQIVRRSTTPDRLFQVIDPKEAEKTAMSWEVYPEGLYEVLRRVHREYGDIDLYVTENGAAYPDRQIERGVVQDHERVAYLQSHLQQAHRAIQEGVSLRGYFVWSLLDNFEWAHGYSMRFGLFRVDYETQKRTWKQSGRWYRETIKRNALQVD